MPSQAQFLLGLMVSDSLDRLLEAVRRDLVDSDLSYEYY